MTSDPIIQALIKRRLQLNVLPQEISVKCSWLSTENILKWERGDWTPSLQQVQYWARILGCTLDLVIVNTPAFSKPIVEEKKPRKKRAPRVKKVKQAPPEPPKVIVHYEAPNNRSVLPPITPVSVSRIVEISNIKTINTTDISEATEDFFKKAKLAKPKPVADKNIVKKTLRSISAPLNATMHHGKKPKVKKITSISEQAAIEEFIRTKGVTRLPTPGSPEFSVVDEAAPLKFDYHTRRAKREVKADA